MSKTVLVRLSVDFLTEKEGHDRVPGKYISLLDSEGREITSGELYVVGYEDEDGNECDEDGVPFNK